MKYRNMPNELRKAIVRAKKASSMKPDENKSKKNHTGKRNANAIKFNIKKEKKKRRKKN